MTVALGCTWNPRGEMARLKRLLPAMQAVYAGIAIVFPPHADQVHRDALGEIREIRVVHSPEWAWGRHLALGEAAQMNTSHVQYADLDRLLRWVETRPEEWRRSVSAVEQADCLIFGRTESAYQTHPAAIRETENISNQVFSTLLGQAVDLSAGAKGFSREAAVEILENSPPGRALGTDAEWPVLLYESGYRIDMMWVDGLDWESADRFLDQAADSRTQKAGADRYDQNPENWALRVGVAQEIIAAGLGALQRKRRL